MDKVYDERYHLHLGYYENNCDYESVAFKRKTEDIWDIYYKWQKNAPYFNEGMNFARFYYFREI